MATTNTTKSLLQFDPSDELTFKKSGELPITTKLTLTNNNSNQDVLFRVQTTSPATYRVRPSHGRIAVGEMAEVQIVMVSEPVKQDKFLIKHVVIGSDTAVSDDFMRQFEEASSSLVEKRLKVVFLDEQGSTISPFIHRAASRSPTAESIQRSGSINSTVGAGGSSLPDVSSSRNTTNDENDLINMNSGTGGGDQQLLEELKEARAKIRILVAKNSELTKALDESTQGTKKRDANNSNDQLHQATKLPQGITESELNALIAAQAGYPPVLVILIAIFAFLIGLMF